jgi:hypothetical protein
MAMSPPPTGVFANPGETPEQTLARYVADYHSPDRPQVLIDIQTWVWGAPPEGIVVNPGETPAQTLARYTADYHAADATAVLGTLQDWVENLSGGAITVTVNVAPALPSSATLTPDTNADIPGTISGSTISFVVPASRRGWGAQLQVTAPGFAAFSERLPSPLPLVSGPVSDPITLTAAPIVVTAPSIAPAWTPAQLRDFQGDCIIWCPELKPNYVNGVDPDTGIHQGAAGIDNGWVWTGGGWLQWYPPAKRQVLYAKIKGYGFTHVQLMVSSPGVNGGYHNLRPTTQADNDAFGALTDTVHKELVAAGLIPVCVGVAPLGTPGGASLAPGFDRTQVLVAMSDWDNTNYAAGRIKCLSETFPNALLYFERPNNATYPQPDLDPQGADPIAPTRTNGGQWIAAMQKLYPRFVGVCYEYSGPGPIAALKAEMDMCHTWWRDVQQVRFEVDTYQKTWQNFGLDASKAFNDELGAKCSQLAGFMSGGTTHPVIAAPPVTVVRVGAVGIDMIPVAEITFVDGPPIGTFPITTKLTRVDVTLDGVECQFDKRDGPNRWPDTVPHGEKEPGIDMGGLEYSLGMCLNIGGRWYGSAPIETWYGRNVIGGAIQSQDIRDGTRRGQIPANWFYDARWAPMTGYQPKPGELIGIFVVAGDTRNNFEPVKERSNIVLIPLPADGAIATFTWN